MKPKGLAKTLLGTSVLTAAIVVSFVAPTASAASDTWDNGGGDNLWQTGTNWATDAFPGTVGNVFTSTDVATFSTTGAGGTIDLGGTLNILNLTFGVSGGDAASFAIGDANDTLNFTTAGGININSGVTTAQTIGVSGTTINLSSDANAAATFTNNGTGLLTIAGNIAANVASGNGLLTVSGTGNTSITGTITKPGAGSNALKKIGSGTLTLSNGSVWSGTGASQAFGTGTNGNSTFTSPFIVQEGTLLLNGGTHTVTGEAVIGGITAQGGAGQNAKVQVDAGSLAISSWLSIGRGNGIGGVSSDLVLNNAATVTAANLSAGYNGGNAANLPKGTITLNNTSSLSINAGDNSFFLGESAGSNFTMTLNDSSTVTINTGTTGTDSARQHSIGHLGTGTLNINGSATFNDAGASALNVGYQSGTGVVNLNSGTFSHTNSELRVGASDITGTFAGGSGTFNISGGTATVGSLTLARGNSATALMNGTLNVTGGTFTSLGDVIVGWQGAGNTGTVNINGGTMNIGTTVTKWMRLGDLATTNGVVNITSGNLNLNTNSALKFSAGGTGASGTNVINQNGGNVTFYSDNATTVGGTGDLNLQQSGSSTVNNTYNLNGGTLTVPQVASTLTTGNRTFNFNGGTLKAAKANTTFFNLGTGNARANVRNGGAIIDTNGFDVTMAQALLHSNVGGDNATDGGLTKSGTGKLTLSGASTYTGATSISAGTLALASTGSLASTQITTASGATFDVSAVSGYSVASGVTLTNNGTVNGGFTVANGGTLNGSGTFNNAVVVNGALNPGNSPGSQTFAAGLTLGSASVTTMEIAGLGGVAGTDHDFINVTGGTMTFDGSLAVSDFGGYDISAQTGAYNLFDFVTGAGDFDVVTVDGNSLTYNVGTDDWSATSGLVTYNFAEGTGVLSVTVVPEPTAALLGGLGLLGLLRRRRVA